MFLKHQIVLDSPIVNMTGGPLSSLYLNEIILESTHTVYIQYIKRKVLLTSRHYTYNLAPSHMTAYILTHTLNWLWWNMY